jgi:hypothetical protein
LRPIISATGARMMPAGPDPIGTAGEPLEDDVWERRGRVRF